MMSASFDSGPLLDAARRSTYSVQMHRPANQKRLRFPGIDPPQDRLNEGRSAEGRYDRKVPPARREPLFRPSLGSSSNVRLV